MPKINKQYTIGIDIGGTKMSAVLFDGKEVLKDFSLATPKDSLNHLIIMLDALLEPLTDEAKKLKANIKGVGLGTAGVLNPLKDKILKSPNIPILDGVALADKLEEKIGLPVMLDNDTNCFIRAEALMGAGKKYSNIYGVIIGTGIGGAWWIDNKIYQGAHNGAGEPGRMIIDFSELIELEAAYHKLMQNNPGRMSQEAIRGDVLAERAFEELGRFLGIAFANIVNLIDPEAIVIGGGTTESSDLFLREAKKTMKQYIMSPEAKKIKILKSKLGAQAGAVGAALLVA
jgi:glucokinase